MQFLAVFDKILKLVGSHVGNYLTKMDGILLKRSHQIDSSQGEAKWWYKVVMICMRWCCLGTSHSTSLLGRVGVGETRYRGSSRVKVEAFKSKAKLPQECKFRILDVYTQSLLFRALVNEPKMSVYLSVCLSVCPASVVTDICSSYAFCREQTNCVKLVGDLLGELAGY
jgi:hypothetical protein